MKNFLLILPHLYLHKLVDVVPFTIEKLEKMKMDASNEVRRLLIRNNSTYCVKPVNKDGSNDASSYEEDDICDDKSNYSLPSTVHSNSGGVSEPKKKLWELETRTRRFLS